MKAENREILERHIRHWHRIRETGAYRFLSQEVKEEILKVYQQELNPNYHENLWCGDCVMNMMRVIYTHYERTVPEAIIESTLKGETVITVNEDRVQEEKGVTKVTNENEKGRTDRSKQAKAQPRQSAADQGREV